MSLRIWCPTNPPTASLPDTLMAAELYHTVPQVRWPGRGSDGGQDVLAGALVRWSGGLLPARSADAGGGPPSRERGAGGVDRDPQPGDERGRAGGPDHGSQRGRRKAVDVRHEVRRDVLGIPEQPGEGVRARVVQRVFPLRIGGLAEQAVQCRFGHLLRRSNAARG